MKYKNLILGGLIFFANFLPLGAGAVVGVFVNEFKVGTDGWVEFYNNFNSDVDLTGWAINHLEFIEEATTTGTTTVVVSSTSTIGSLSVPSGGLATWALPLNSSAGVILLFDQNNSQQFGVTYGDLELWPGTVFSVPSLAENESAYSFEGRNWGSTSLITKGWFNETPTRASLLAVLPAGVETNLADEITISDPTKTNGLYFMENNFGKITFLTEVNLTATATVATLQELADRLSLADGALKFSPLANSGLQNISAKIEFYNLINDTYTLDNLTIKDDDGNLLATSSPNYPTISEFTYLAGSATGTLSFVTNHFTEFLLATTTTSTTDDTGDDNSDAGGGGGGGSNYIPPPASSGGTAGGGATAEPTLVGTTTEGVVLGASVFRFTKEFGFGARGEEVKELQEILTAEGFYRGKINGIFTNSVKTALQLYQKKNNIKPASGFVGPVTLKFLNNRSENTTNPDNQSTIDKLLDQLILLQKQLVELLTKKK